MHIFPLAGGNYLHGPSSHETEDRFNKTVALRYEKDPNKAEYLICKSRMLAEFKPEALHQKITENMRAHEHFACHRNASGAVVALDEFGICGNGIAFSAVKPAIHKAPGR